MSLRHPGLHNKFRDSQNYILKKKILHYARILILHGLGRRESLMVKSTYYPYINTGKRHKIIPVVMVNAFHPALREAESGKSL